MPVVKPIARALAGSVATIATDTGQQLANFIEEALRTHQGENILIVDNRVLPF